ncbi:hypothetical protein [Candidatus Viridilinea mediisalina]|uniref:HD domain-containing protein n=1 Tax=Candidatus Viridilinea mediisalina TaxID=2024553 RepID=A0A2A6RKA7_9CHLR|nr:hypothetical protein [Candidatus Viridilinea mediisalina]PDW03452.1 hypothetical protein CJ255_08600 [Candidatus Viridilinea mediisalina]
MSSSNQLAYRIRQFQRAVGARLTPAEVALVAELLTPGEWRLFMAMPLYDRRHCLDVYGTLYAAGQRDPVLLRAALIHDCGKVDDAGRPMGLSWYVLATILKRMPGLYLAVARGLNPVAIYAEHAWRGARMAAAAGSPPELVTALRHYHDPQPSGYAALLKWADDQH